MAKITFLDGGSQDLNEHQAAVVQGLGRSIKNSADLEAIMKRYDPPASGVKLSSLEISRHVAGRLAAERSASQPVGA